jgi:dodecin
MPHWSAGYARVELPTSRERAVVMADGVYRVTEVIGVSSESWEAAARSAVETAAKTVRDLRIAEVIKQDVAIEDGTIKHYRVRLAISFKYESSD